MTPNDIFAFSASKESGNICAYRAAKRCRDLSLEALDISSDDFDFIIKKLSVAYESPLLVRSKDKPFIISASHYPSSELCFGVVANVSLSFAKKIFSELYPADCISPSFSSVTPAKRESASSREEIFRILNFISDFSQKRGVLHDVDIQSAERASQASVSVIEKFVGCKTEIKRSFGISSSFDYDISLFSMLALCSLLFAYDKALSRNTTLEFAELSGRLYCAFSFELDKNAEYENNFDFLDSHMEALGMHFALFSKGRHLRVEACALRLDLSQIGLKNLPLFNFEKLD